LLALWLFERFDLSLAAAGAIFFWTGVFAAFSFPIAAWLGSRIGLVNTMIFTFLASLCLIGAAERPAAASMTAVPRSLASAASPALAGALFAAGLQTWPLLICGALKIAYDLLLFAAFRKLKPPEEAAPL
jgi:hypothetical protein